MKNKTTAVLLALFLGGIGAHKFYLGQPGKGIVYLLFCWTGIPMVIALVEAIIIGCMYETDFQMRYAR